MLTRTQVSLDSEQHRKAKSKAAELGLSLAEYVRRLVDRDLERPSRTVSDIAALFDLGDSGGSDVSAYKQDYLSEAVEKEHLRKTRRS
ncbi:MAG: hypothetical protein ACR2FO_03020 [Actinomycetota bacterium]